MYLIAYLICESTKCFFFLADIFRTVPKVNTDAPLSDIFQTGSSAALLSAISHSLPFTKKMKLLLTAIKKPDVVGFRACNLSQS